MEKAAAFDVVVLGASAGGEAAILAILKALPPDFAVPLVVMQHLPPASSFVEVYGPRVPLAVEWAGARSVLAAGKVLVCPPQAYVELLADGSLQLLPCEGGALQRPIDRLLQSAARSFAHRAIGVVLSGMGNDGAAGARELHAAGAQVLVQSEASAQYPDMPRAAIAAGAASLVVPLCDLAQVIAELVAGAPRPRARSELQAVERVFGGVGDIAALARGLDWARTPLGPALDWPVELRLMARTAMESPWPMAVWWGPALVQLYNEPWRRFLGAGKHPEALGRPAHETWGEIWSDVGPMVERVMQQGVAVGGEDVPMVIERHGHAEEVHVTFACSPIRDAAGAVVGVHNTVSETTRRVVAERRLHALRTLAERVGGADTPRQACEQAAAALAAVPPDLSFALLYLFDARRRQATLAGAAGLPAGSGAAPHTWTVDGAHDPWPLQRLLEGSAHAGDAGVVLDDLARRLPALPALLEAHAGRPVPRQAVLLPLRLAAEEAPIGALVAAPNPQRPLDDDCRGFLALVARHVNAGLIEARARQLEHERLERLAGIDRAKAQAALRESDARNEVLLRLSDAIRPLRDAQQVKTAAADVLGQALGVNRAFYADVDGGDWVVGHLYERDIVAAQPGRYPMAGFSSWTTALFCAGTTLVIESLHADPRFAAAERDAHEAFEIRAAVAVPLVKEGALLAICVVHAAQPRPWTPGEIELVREVAERTWAAVERARADAALRMSEARYRTLIDSIDEGFVLAELVHDAQGRAVDALYLEGNPAASRLTGVPAFNRHSINKLMPGAEPYWLDIYDRVARTGVAERLERYAAPLGRWYDFHVSRVARADELHGEASGGKPRLAVVFQEITARKQAEAALRDSEQRLALAFETLPMGIGIFDAAGDPVMLNDGMRRFLPTGIIPSRDPERLGRWQGWDAGGLRIEPQDFPGARALRGETVSAGMQMLYRDDEDRETWTEVRSAPLRDGEGGITGALMVVIDIDRLKRSEQAARESQERQAFLLALSDALRARPDERSIKDQAVKMLAAHLRLDHCWISEVSESQATPAAGAEHCRPGLAPMAGGFRLSDFPETMAGLAAQPVAVHDAADDARLPAAEKALLAGLQLRALLVAPLRGGERHVVGALAAAMAAPRRWSDGERVLLEEVAERLCSAVERARGEAAAARAERRAEAIIERMGDAHCVLDREFRIQHVNAATERLLGVSRTALVGHSHWDIFPASVDAPVGRAFRRVVAEGVEQHLRHHYTGEGYDLHIELDAYPTDEGGVAIFWRDVTERVQAEEALRESEEKYRALFNQMDEAYAVVEVMADAAGRWNDFLFLEVNAAFMRHTGMPYPVGRTATQLLGTPNPRWAQLYGQAAQTGESIRLEEGELTLGRVFDLNIFRLGGQGSRRVAVLFTDITERRRAKQALHDSEARMRAIANLVPAMLWRSDALGQVQWYSERWFDYTGLPPSRALVEGWAAIIHPDDLRATQRRWKVSTRRRHPYRFEHRLRRHDGEYRWFLSRAEPLLDEGGGVRAWFGSVTDIHEQRCARELLEQRVKERTRELERAGEQRRQLLARVETLQDEERRRIARELHDSLGQLLSALLLSVTSVRAQPMNAREAGHFGKLQQLLQATDHELDRIVFTLRPTALEDSGLADAVAAYVATWSELCGQPVDLLVNGLQGQRLPARVEAAVFRVIQEALNNIAKHARADSVSVILERLGGDLVGSVEDDGVGFDSEQACAADGSRPSWGLLGMRERIEALGGRFDIESHPGQGTTVLLRVPLQ